MADEQPKRTHTARLLKILDEELKAQRSEPEYVEERIAMRKKHGRLVDEYVHVLKTPDAASDPAPPTPEDT